MIVRCDRAFEYKIVSVHRVVKFDISILRTRGIVRCVPGRVRRCWPMPKGGPMGSHDVTESIRRIATALEIPANRNIERPLTDRKEMNWGKRKLKRDQQ